MSYHVPVLCDAVVEHLVVDPGGIYLDATAGGGGHSEALLRALDSEARVWSVDRDADAVEQAARVLSQDERARVRRASFAELDALLDSEGVDSLSGALFDLGVSSHQIDAAHRGFSYRSAGPLDMRMDSTQSKTAADIIAFASERELLQIVRDFGEERRAGAVAKSIARMRERAPLQTTGDLRRAVEDTRPQMLNKTLARVFQAFRIAVNSELDQLAAGLDAAIGRLAVGGRLAVIAYHSLEDRLVKQRLAERMRGCVCPPRMPVCACGRRPEFVKVGRGRIRPSADETAINSRARSAVLRLFEKVEECA